ncbi:hypothetical protein [Escherichia coli]|uniref:hypothetical protein n=1 Tax=Escherichia coli TaxID=562 RepID=UPI001080ECC3|nr:hypothetical protein [Escherichia coli]TGG16657.1 hypothetical protein DAH26_30285 [Escherichia coli]
MRGKGKRKCCLEGEGGEEGGGRRKKKEKGRRKEKKREREEEGRGIERGKGERRNNEWKG